MSEQQSKNYKEDNLFIGAKIQSYRKRLKWSQARLAEKVGIQSNTVSAWELGRITIPYAQLVAVAAALEINHVELLPPESIPVDDTMSNYVNTAKSKLQPNELAFLEKLIEKTLSLEEDERKDFLKNIKFAVEFYDQNE